MSKHLSKAKKKKIVKMYLQGESPKSLCEYYSIPKSTLYTWIYQSSEKKRRSKYLAPSTEYNGLVKHATKLEHELEILRAFIDGLEMPKNTKYSFMDNISKKDFKNFFNSSCSCYNGKNTINVSEETNDTMDTSNRVAKQ